MAGLDIGYEIGTDRNYQSIWDVDDLCSFITTHNPSAWGRINVGQDPGVSQRHAETSPPNPLSVYGEGE